MWALHGLKNSMDSGDRVILQKPNLCVCLVLRNGRDGQITRAQCSQTSRKHAIHFSLISSTIQLPRLVYRVKNCLPSFTTMLLSLSSEMHWQVAGSGKTACSQFLGCADTLPEAATPRLPKLCRVPCHRYQRQRCTGVTVSGCTLEADSYGHYHIKGNRKKPLRPIPTVCSLEMKPIPFHLLLF